MSWEKAENGFVVVVNHEEQYSIWPDYKALPEGWSAVGQQGDKAQCLAWIEQHWTDMRPLSLRVALQSGSQC
ncbi:putative MbtH [Pseudomonas sp. XWY-1]|uniref:MbtH family protein n=1 Tax=Pseudomonas sp. XWY-1 TaxID=2069256 RepID=UPI000CDBE2E1|nr:MbtH family NRPS accessory protein [Pseudomonas sp. XWY-1]AUZ58494.1 putative MbtH [Pseudomonas sp. XWY-1]